MKIEIKNKYKDYTYLVLALEMGHRCGYVKIPSKSKLYKVEYYENLGLSRRIMNNKKIGKRGIIPVFCWDGKTITPEILFDVHGGLTFSGKLRDMNGWWLGFDCAHSGDGKDKSIMDSKNLEIEEKYGFNFGDEVIRTKEYVEQECKNLIDQIIKYNL
mgnify:CR=1 FL=1